MFKKGGGRTKFKYNQLKIFHQWTTYGKCNVGDEEFKNKILSKFASIREGEGKFKYNYMINNHKSVGGGKN